MNSGYVAFCHTLKILEKISLFGNSPKYVFDRSLWIFVTLSATFKLIHNHSVVNGEGNQSLENFWQI